LLFSGSDLSSPIKTLTYAFDTLEEFQLICTANDYFMIRQFLFLSFHQLVTKNQIPNTKCQPNFFLLWSQFEKKRGQGISFLFE
jgi:hypothetical protein